MKTLKKVEIEPVWIETIPNEMEQGKIYISEKYQTANHLCLCGCGNQTITPFGERSKMWGLVKEKDGKISLTGSVGNYSFPCKSHYIITKKRRKLCVVYER